MGTKHAGAAMAVGSIFFVQFGLAASVPLFDELGPGGVAALRLGWGGLILLALVRPRPGDFSRRALLACVGLGVATAGLTTLFMAAVARLPMGTATALEFLGPLGVAAVRGPRSARAWPVVAAVGVALLTEPWRGGVDLVGVGYALGAGACWAAYIVLTQRVGDEVSGVRGLAVSMPVAGLVATAVAGPGAFGDLTWQLVLVGLGLAILVPVVPFTLELLALRRLTASAFGVLMSLEPAAALLIGLLVLHQVPGPAAVAGIALVVTASIGAQRTGARPEAVTESIGAQRAGTGPEVVTESTGAQGTGTGPEAVTESTAAQGTGTGPEAVTESVGAQHTGARPGLVADRVQPITLRPEPVVADAQRITTAPQPAATDAQRIPAGPEPAAVGPHTAVVPHNAV
jgi:inner membrane transporter RhtA